MVGAEDTYARTSARTSAPACRPDGTAQTGGRCLPGAPDDDQNAKDSKTHRARLFAQRQACFANGLVPERLRCRPHSNARATQSPSSQSHSTRASALPEPGHLPAQAAWDHCPRSTLGRRMAHGRCTAKRKHAQTRTSEPASNVSPASARPRRRRTYPPEEPIRNAPAS